MKLIHRFKQIVGVEIDVTRTLRKETPMKSQNHRRTKGFIIEGLLLLLVLIGISAAVTAPVVASNPQKPDQGTPQVNVAKTVTEGARAGDAVLRLSKDADNSSDATPDTDSGGDGGFGDSIGDFLQGLLDSF
jgi:type II secretory pathway pseudopilin PulG